MSVARADAVARPSLTLRRRLNAPAEKVYAAWTDPKKIVKWFGPDAGPVTKAEIDLRVGGRFDIGFHTEDGEYHQVGGVYRDVVPNEMLAFTWAWHTMKERESFVKITIKRDGDGSILTLLHENFIDEAARDGHSRGWTGTLDKLEKLFA